MAIRRSFRGSGRGPRRLTEWGFLASTSSQTLAASTNVHLGGFSQALLGESTPLTLVRVRGEIVVASDQESASEMAIGAFGICIVKEAARVAGVASLPAPATDADDSIWQTWSPWSVRMSFGTAVGFQMPAGQHYEIDSKAMRKLDTGDAIAVLAENTSSVGAQIVVNLRLLFKLH